MSLIRYFFQWYTGPVWSNIVASLLWSAAVGIPAFFWGRSKARKHLTRIHDRLDVQDAHMASHAATLQEVHKHVTKIAGGKKK